MGGVFQTDAQDQRHDGSGNEGGNGHAQDTHVQSENANGIACDVQNVANDGGVEGDAGFAHGAKQRRIGVVEAKKGVGNDGNHQICQGCIHYIGFNGAEQQGQKSLAPNGNEQGQDGCPGENREYHLIGGIPGLADPVCPQVLTDHHRAAGGQGCQNAENQVIYHVH